MITEWTLFNSILNYQEQVGGDQSYVLPLLNIEMI